jgi:hypothetical protein
MLDQCIELKTSDESVAEMLSAIYTAFTGSRAPDAASVDNAIRIFAIGLSLSWFVTHADSVVQCDTLAQLLFTVEKFITMELQLRRPEIFFVHAAAVSTGTEVIVVCGESGAGKSTLCWSLCAFGYQYLSDELAPVSLDGIHVLPFPKAISLKSRTKDSPSLPTESIDAGATFHVPADTLPAGCETTPLPISSIVILLPESPGDSPGLFELPAAEAAARLYANGLNQLAHADDGLEAAVSIVRGTKCCGLRRAELPRTLAAVGGIAAANKQGSTPSC